MTTVDWTAKPANVVAGLAPWGWHLVLQAENGDELNRASIVGDEAAEAVADRNRELVQQRFRDHPDESRVYLTTWEGTTGEPYSRAWYDRDDVGL